VARSTHASLGMLWRASTLCTVQGVHAQPTGDRSWAQAPAAPQVQDLALDRRTGASRAVVRAAGPVDHPGRAQLPVPVGPPFGGGGADLEPFRGAPQRPAVIHDTLGELQTAALGQSGVSVAHEDLRCEYGTCGSSTLTRRSSPFKIIRSCPVTNLCGQHN